MANTKKRDSSTGKESTKTPPLASAKGKAAKLSKPAPTQKDAASGLKILADILSLLQEDARRYNKALARAGGGDTGALLLFSERRGAIVLPAPHGHTLGYKDGHITLDGKPVTGWGDTGK